MTDFICMIKHLRREVSPILIIIRILPLFRLECLLPSNHLPHRHRTIPHHPIFLFHPHLLNPIIVVVIFILQCQFRVLFYPVRHFSRLQTYYVKLTMLLIVNLSFIECQAIISIIRQLRVCYIYFWITFLSCVVFGVRLILSRWLTRWMITNLSILRNRIIVLTCLWAGCLITISGVVWIVGFIFWSVRVVDKECHGIVDIMGRAK